MTRLRRLAAVIAILAAGAVLEVAVLAATGGGTNSDGRGGTTDASTSPVEVPVRRGFLS